MQNGVSLKVMSQCLIDVLIGLTGGDRDGAGDTVASLSLISGGGTTTIVVSKCVRNCRAQVKAWRASKTNGKSKSQRTTLIALAKHDHAIIQHMIELKMSHIHRPFLHSRRLRVAMVMTCSDLRCVNVDGNVLRWCCSGDRNNANDNRNSQRGCSGSAFHPPRKRGFAGKLFAQSFAQIRP